jgi:hypothetical protein
MEKEDEQNEIMKLAEKMYEGLSVADIEEMERVMLDRTNFFGERTKRIDEILEGINDDDIREVVNFGKPTGESE